MIDVAARGMNRATGWTQLFPLGYYLETLEFGLELSQSALHTRSLEQALPDATHFVATSTSSIGGFASRRLVHEGPPEVVPETVAGFEQDRDLPLMLVRSDGVLRAHSGGIGLDRIPHKGTVLHVAAVPLCRGDQPAVGMALARPQEFALDDLETINIVRRLAEPVIEISLPRDLALRQEAIDILAEAARYLDQALARYDDDLERENCMAIVESKLYSLAPYMRLSSNLQDAVTLWKLSTRLRQSSFGISVA